MSLTLPAVGQVLASSTDGSSQHHQSILHGVITSTNNASTTPLAGSATYTGTWETAPTDGVTVSVLADAAGTLYFDFSNDGGTTLHSTFPSNGFVVAAGIHEFHRAAVNGRAFRVRLVNGSAAQTSLSLAAYYGPHSHPSAPVNQNLGSDADAMVVRTFPEEVDMALGRLGGVQRKQQHGNTLAIDAADAPVDIWDFSSDDLSTRLATKTFPTASGDIFLSSDSTSDTAVDIAVTYVDANGDLQTATKTLTGQTPVDLGDNGYDVLHAVVSGSTALVGNVYINTANAHTLGIPNDLTTVIGFIRAADGHMHQAGYTVPAGKQMIITHVVLGIQRASGAAGSASVLLRTRLSGETWIIDRHFYPTTGSTLRMEVGGIILPALANVVLRADDVSDADTNILGEINFDLVDA
jgi:hypothetical protein